MSASLLFDNALAPSEVGDREQYEAIARSVRDILSQRWQHTEATYSRENPKQIYYLSMEFLIGRSLSNNILNLRLDPVARRFFTENQLDELAILAGRARCRAGQWRARAAAACFLNSMATMQLPGMGYGLRFEYGMFKQEIVNGWQCELPDNWLRRPDPWEVARPHLSESR